MLLPSEAPSSSHIQLDRLLILLKKSTLLMKIQGYFFFFYSSSTYFDFNYKANTVY